MAPTLDAIRNCLDGGIPSVIATCALDGTPNVAYLSQVHFVDNSHVALSFQFFNKTRENVLANPRAMAQVVDPDTGSHYRLALQYLRTETEGPLFENMKAKLAGIASHTGMSKVFRLLGADVYLVLDIEAVPGTRLPAPTARRSALSALRACADRLTRCVDLAGLLDELLLGLEREFAFHHTMVLLVDEKGDRLYTVASRGYAQSGIGSEIQMGEGVIGVAARERTPIRIGHMAREYLYSRAVRQSFQQANPAENLETEIPLPGLRESRSQLAVPVTLGARLFGVLYVESPQDQRFSYEDEDALVTLTQQLAMAIHLIEAGGDVHDDTASVTASKPAASGAPTTIRHYAANHSVFIDGDYLIKGVAGAIFWKLLGDFVKDRRIEFTNRELRLDPAIRLPDICENLEARLILLQKRLGERCDFMRLEKAGRGRLRLIVERPIKLVEMPGD
jgi:adenylate cyclase